MRDEPDIAGAVGKDLPVGGYRDISYQNDDADEVNRLEESLHRLAIGAILEKEKQYLAVGPPRRRNTDSRNKKGVRTKIFSLTTLPAGLTRQSLLPLRERPTDGVDSAHATRIAVILPPSGLAWSARLTRFRPSALAR
jgi:hypothetical protein